MKNWKEEFDEIGFNNQTKIIGFKRIELKQFISTLLEQQRKEVLERLPKEKGKNGLVEMIFNTNKGERKYRISVETNYDLGWNECLKEIKSLINKQ